MMFAVNVQCRTKLIFRIILCIVYGTKMYLYTI